MVTKKICYLYPSSKLLSNFIDFSKILIATFVLISSSCLVFLKMIVIYKCSMISMILKLLSNMHLIIYLGVSD